MPVAKALFSDRGTNSFRISLLRANNPQAEFHDNESGVALWLQNLIASGE